MTGAHDQPGHQPSPHSAIVVRGCPGTTQPQLDCNSINASAAVRQADAAERFNQVVWVEIGVGLLTALVAALAAYWAKEAAKAANKALSHERKRSAAELRPWLEIDARPTRFVSDPEGFEIEYEVTFKNIGQTIAEQFSFQMDGSFAGTLNEHVGAKFAEWDSPPEPSPLALMPGEQRSYTGFTSSMKRVLPWYGSKKSRPVAFVVTASAFYRSGLDDLRHRTDRSFLIGRRSEKGLISGYFLYEDMVGEGLEIIAVRPSLAGKTT